MLQQLRGKPKFILKPADKGFIGLTSRCSANPRNSIIKSRKILNVPEGRQAIDNLNQ
jgi:hypothetical protein